MQKREGEERKRVTDAAQYLEPGQDQSVCLSVCSQGKRARAARLGKMLSGWVDAWLGVHELSISFSWSNSGKMASY